MTTWFTSDLHFGQRGVGLFRDHFSDRDDHLHNERLLDNINSTVHKRDKLFILGDVAFTAEGMVWASQINCRHIELILGNHDTFSIPRYQAMGWRIHGFRKYENWWLSHCPIHPSEIYRANGNIHGHVHNRSPTFGIIQDHRYVNVNIDVTGYVPVKFTDIEKKFHAKEAAICAFEEANRP